MSYTHQFEITPRKTQETDTLVDIISSHKSSYIFTGDLNAVPGSYTINRIAKYLKNAGPDITQATWTTKPFSYDNFEETELKWRLDYIFATDDIKVTSTEILNTNYSDHLPILAKFELG
jgi:endonuclease/exonuclease/phosphatase (EEP) superfamily protein YafD